MNVFKSTMIGYGLLAVVSAATPAPQTSQPVPPRPGPAGVVGSIGLDGSIDKFDSAAHTALVKTADGLSHLVHLTDRTTVHGIESNDPLRGLREGSHVVVHYVEKNSRKTAVEVDRVGAGRKGKRDDQETQGTSCHALVTARNGSGGWGLSAFGYC